MTSHSSTTSPVVRVAIDVAKLTHQVLLELPERPAPRRCASRTPSRRSTASWRRCARSTRPCEIAFEPTGDYHRPLAYVLGQAGFQLASVSSLAVARTREALYNSWDKNDPKDAQVILHLLKNGHDAAVSRSAGDRAPGPAGDGQHLSAGVAAQGAAPAQPS